MASCFWVIPHIVDLFFIAQKRIVRIIMGAKRKDSSKELFSELGILTSYSQYIFATDGSYKSHMA
jgi:hypothetical protein